MTLVEPRPPMTDGSVIPSDGLEVRSGLPVRSFADAAAFDAWLEAEPRTSKGAWLRLAKIGSGSTSITRAEAVDVLLCHGWIDGQQARYDEASWLVRITPRKPSSRWSQINRARAIELDRLGLVRPVGGKEIDAAKADGRWDAAYAPASTIEIPRDLQVALDSRPDAAAHFGRMKRGDRYAILYRIATVKKAETRARLVRDYIALFASESSG